MWSRANPMRTLGVDHDGFCRLLRLGKSSQGSRHCRGRVNVLYPILAKWADAYKTKTGVAVNYQSIGSGGGIKQIHSKTVDFGGSDAPSVRGARQIRPRAVSARHRRRCPGGQLAGH